MEHISGWKQTKIYTQKCFRIFRFEKGWKTFISAAVITFLICMVTSENMFDSYTDTRTGVFAIVCACIWIGIFNSIQSICKERDIIKREYRSGLQLSSYLNAHFLFEMALCAVESAIVDVIICIANISNLHPMGVILPFFLELLISAFLIIYASDALGIMISSIVKTPNTAMTVMPFVLIIQLIMAGMIFKLEGLTEWISYVTISKWGLCAICTSADVNSMFLHDSSLTSDYDFTPLHLLEIWIIFIIFIVIYRVIAQIFLKRVELDKR
ncbi:MAG: ABC transporter permease [Oscillospiraceae bacterium]